MHVHGNTLADFNFVGTKCDYEFCFVCFAPWKMIMAIGNTAHALDCKHHSDHLPEIGHYEEEFEFDEGDFLI